jgi:4-aminobutyrate aminotransferase-like enzyme
LTTIGKPMGNGMPVAGLLAQREVLAAFADRLPYFNTFGGNPVSMAAAAAVLAVIEEEDLQTNASLVGSVMLAELTSLADSHPALGNVRGAGLYIGLDVVHPSSTEPDSATALELVEALRDRRVLTSVCGPGGNVLKLRPPLVFNLADVDWLLTALEDSLKTLGL